MPVNHSPELEDLLVYLSASRGFDFTAYKRATLMRRVQKRMQDVGTDNFTDYREHLETHPDEFTLLFNTILINVTSFFRDAPTWDLIERELLPAIVERKAPADPIRVWSAGCASGEETYSLAMLLAERLGANDFRKRVKIYGTDVDEDALVVARHASYHANAMSDVPEELRDRYFERLNGTHSFRKDLRSNVIFGRLDLLQDAPISRVDLLLCRNTLMYFNSDAQGRVIARLVFALADRGYLVLGKAETLLTHTPVLTPVDLKLRTFEKTSRSYGRNRALNLLVPDAGVEPPPQTPGQLLRDIAFETDPAPQITIDSSGVLAGLNDRARQMFGLRTTDVGRLLQDLELSYRPLELRSLIDTARTDQRTVIAPDVEWVSPTGATRWFTLTVIPLPQDGGGSAGANIMFTDVTRFKELEWELQRSKSDLETAYEELQSTNEELETTNEELQSTIEELETTNEELQSTNEELETMNEELQSTNEELESVNMETRDRSGELNTVNLVLETILRNQGIGVIVVNQEMVVQVWNRIAEDLWGLRADETVGTHFMNLDIGFPIDDVRAQVRDCLSTGTPASLVLPALNRRGRNIQCRFTCIPMRLGEEVTSAILLMEEVDKAQSPK